MVRLFSTAQKLWLSLLFSLIFVWGGVAVAAPASGPYSTATVPANATCKALYQSGYNPAAFTTPSPTQINQFVDQCYPPYGNQIPNVNLTEDESGNWNFPAPNPPAPQGWNEQTAWNTVAVGYDNNQSRPIYQPLVFNYLNYVTNGYANHEILFNGDIAGTSPNPLLAGSPVQNNGTSIVDVTVPSATVALSHIPPGPTASDPAVEATSGAQMVRVCSGNQLNADALSAAANSSYGTSYPGNTAIANKVFLLRENGNGGSHGTQDILDVTNPTTPVFVADLFVNNNSYSGGVFTAKPLPAGTQATHKSWWECDTGLAYIVAGKTADNFATLQHVYVYNLRDPTRPVFIRQYAIAGGELPAAALTGSCTNAPSSTCYEGTTNPPASVHGPISMGNLVNRVYNPWGVGSDGVIQIMARDAMINGCFTSAALAWDQTGTATGFNSAASANCAALPGSGLNPTNADELFGQISVNCSGQMAHDAWIEDIGEFQLPGAFHAASGGFANVTGAADAYKKTYAATDAQQWPIASLSVPEQPGGFCAKGFRYGAHAVTEAIFPAYYGKIQCVSWFGAGARCWDIRDMKNPQPIATWISMPGPATTSIGTLGTTMATAGTYYKAPGGPANAEAVDRNATDQNYVEFDDRGYLYIGDRAGTGTAILQFSGGTAAATISAPNVQPGTCPGGNCGSP